MNVFFFCKAIFTGGFERKGRQKWEDSTNQWSKNESIYVKIEEKIGKKVNYIQNYIKNILNIIHIKRAKIVGIIQSRAPVRRLLLLLLRFHWSHHRRRRRHWSRRWWCLLLFQRFSIGRSIRRRGSRSISSERCRGFRIEELFEKIIWFLSTLPILIVTGNITDRVGDGGYELEKRK